MAEEKVVDQVIEETPETEEKVDAEETVDTEEKTEKASNKKDKKEKKPKSKKKKAVLISVISILLVGAIVLGVVLLPEKETPPAPIVVDNTNMNTISAYDVNSAIKLSIDASKEISDISDLLFGAFFEDINFAADGGLYAELVANRSFEFSELAAGDSFYGWNNVGAMAAAVKSDSAHSLNMNNPNYVVLNNTSGSAAGIENIGYLDGISITEGAEYKVSFYAKGINGYAGKVYAKLVVNGEDAGSVEFEAIENTWGKYEATITSTKTAHSDVRFQILIDDGEAYFDMISLFPVDTYKGRENGLRKDLCEMLEGMQPKFLRFPGGCVIEGYDANTAYNWKDSIGVDENGNPLKFNGKYGDVAARKQGQNIWTATDMTDDQWPSFMSYGLGFYEYFLLSEDIGAVGVPVLNCGLYCQMRGMGPVPMDTPEFEQYLQDMVDLIEFCRGDASTKWGAVRISMGHEEPFELKYIGIGNENEGTDYYERYSAFLQRFNEEKAKNPELYEGLELIYSAGASDATHSGNYIKSYDYAKKQLDKIGSTNPIDFAGATDQHYYNDPEWFMANVNYYDPENYSRDYNNMTSTIYGGGIPVFLGEYAARSNTLKASLAEAAYMTGLEKNGDIVKMAAYAPLFSSGYKNHWAPNLIWFNNYQVTGSISYYVQKLFAKNQGSKLLSYTFTGASQEKANLKGMVGVGTWYTSAKFDNATVTSLDGGKTLKKNGFGTFFSLLGIKTPTDGKWTIKKGALVQKSTDMEYSETGSVAYFGNVDWENYCYTVEATKIEGQEGFLIPFAVQDKENNYFWNIGGWGNTVSCLQHMENGVKTGQIIGTVKDFKVETGKTYKLKIEVRGTQVKCYIDDVLYVDYDFGKTTEADVYSVVSKDDNGDILIKLVNVTHTSKPIAVDLKNANIQSTATIYQVRGESLEDDNILGQEEDCKMEEFTMEGFSNQFTYTIPAYSVTCIRLKNE